MESKEFNYTYSAKEQEELKKIRQKYQPKEVDKMEQIRKLDAGVTQKGTIYSIATGILGALVMGSGMSLLMTNLGESIGMNGTVTMVLGSIIGIIGLGLVGLAYPLYHYITKKERERIAPEILRLTDELMK